MDALTDLILHSLHMWFFSVLIFHIFDRPNRYPGTVISFIKHFDGDEDTVITTTLKVDIIL